MIYNPKPCGKDKQKFMLKKYYQINFIIPAIFTVFFSVYTAFGQIHIEHWIHQPSKSALHRPLVYVDFWATWCAPCISSMPHTQTLEHKYGENILFVYISDEPENRIETFMQDKNYDFFTANDTKRLNYDDFDIRNIPTSILLNPEGKVLWRGKPWELDDRILRKFVRQYKYQTGEAERFLLNKPDTTDNDRTNDLKNGSGFSLQYKQFDYAVPFQAIKDGDLIIYKGDLKDILSAMFHAKPYQIQLPEEAGYWKIIFDKEYEGRQDDVAVSFLKTAGFELKVTSKKTVIYRLNETGNTSWLDKRLYQYAESPGQTLTMSDEHFLTIDNASPDELARILSDKTPWIFDYTGSDTDIYDWNIRIDSLENLLNNLTSDLDFNVQKSIHELPIYSITAK